MQTINNSDMKVLITGPESSGKSYLAQQLAVHFHGVCVPEYARTFFKKHSTYSQKDLFTIAQRQLESESKLAQPGKPLFCDTGVEVVHIWSQVKYQSIHSNLQNLLNFQPYNLVLLCEPNIPWEPDPLREYPENEARHQLFLMYQEFLHQYGVTFFVINQSIEKRLDQAIQLVYASIMSANQKP